MLRIELDDLSGPQVLALLEEHLETGRHPAFMALSLA
jgi:hypothetical protein